MIQPRLVNALRKIVGSEHVSLENVALEAYSYDASLAVRRPDAVVFPANTEETSAVVSALSRENVPFTPRGFGTNLSGGSVAIGGGVVIGLSRLNRILAIETANRCASVQPGVTNLELQNALAPLGYYYAPDPASQKVSTIGGNIGENSGGPHCLKYGVTTNHVLGVTVVLPDGETAVIGGPALDPPGWDLRGLMVGSEGTLGIVTEAVVRILPKPESVVTLLAVYDDGESAAQSVSDIIAAGIVPATLEMMDAPIIEAVEKSLRCGYPLDAAAVLIIEVDGLAAGLRRQAERIAEICRKNRCGSVREAKDAAERDRLWAGRRGAFGAVARLAPNYLVNDCTVPRSKLPEALARVAKIVKEHGLRVGNVFHAGDGNLHPLVLFDSRDKDQLHRVESAGQAIMETCVALGGTISGEHGIGVEKREAMRMIFSEDALEFQRAVKKAFDPHGLLNPDKIVPPRGGAAPPPPQPVAASPLNLTTSEAASDRRQIAPAGLAGDPAEPDRHGSASLAADELARYSQPIPFAELEPADEDEACGMVRQALLNRTRLIPLGGASRWPGRGDDGATRLRSTKLCSLVEHDRVNQVVIVQAGMTLAALQQTLAAHDQWLPIRPPLGDRCTVGGLAALNACGPDRLRYGAPRDWLLGLKFVSTAGRLIKAGGRVVKNVAGYDLTRLLCGSAGSLGLLTELTFRTLPLPERCVALEGRGEWASCGAVASRLLDSALEPVFIVASSDGGHKTSGQWRLSVGYEGFAETVENQLQHSEGLFEQAGLQARSRRDYLAGQDLFAAAYSRLHSADFLACSDVPLSRVSDLVPRASSLLSDAEILADLGCGRMYAAAHNLPGDAWTALRRLTEERNGHTVLERAPALREKSRIAADRTRPEGKLTGRLKKELDPYNVFVGGRFWDSPDGQ